MLCGTFHVSTIYYITYDRIPKSFTGKFDMADKLIPLPPHPPPPPNPRIFVCRLHLFRVVNMFWENCEHIIVYVTSCILLYEVHSKRVFKWRGSSLGNSVTETIHYTLSTPKIDNNSRRTSHDKTCLCTGMAHDNYIKASHRIIPLPCECFGISSLTTEQYKR